MNLQFATCERGRALGFLQKLYPSSIITDTRDSAKDILDLVEADIVRIPDPYMHGKRVHLYPSRNWNNTKKDEYMVILKNFHNHYK